MEINWRSTAFYAAGTKIGPLVRACRLDERFSYFMYLPKGTRPDNINACRLIVTVHGTYRDAERLKNAFADFAEMTNSIILAPLFPCGIIEREDIDNYKFVKFHDIRFDEIVLDMVDDVRETLGYQEEKFGLYGFSGGGQFVHRMFYLHPHRLAFAAVGAPGRPTYLRDDVAWPNGTAGFAEVFGRGIDEEALGQVPVLLFCGEEDTEQIDYGHDETARVMERFGSNRLERMQALYDNYLEHGISAELLTVPGAAHEEYKMIGLVQTRLAEIIGSGRFGNEKSGNKKSGDE